MHQIEQLHPRHQRRDLLDHDQRELAQLMATLAPPTAAPAGSWHGTLMAIGGLQRLPRFLRTAINLLLDTPVNPWRGKTFAADTGSNLWLPGFGARFAHYRIEHRDSPVDDQPVVWLDYDVPENPRWLRPIRGEARQLRTGQLLCRMNWQTGKGLVPLLYFTLTEPARD